MVTTGAEVKSGSKNVPITCTISEVTIAPTVTWRDEVGTINNGADYNFQPATRTDTTAKAVLTIYKASTVTTTYTCFISTLEWSLSAEPYTVNLKVYGKQIYIFNSNCIFMKWHRKVGLCMELNNNFNLGLRISGDQ